MGNPDLKKYQFTTTRERPLTEQAAFRVDKPTKAALKAGKSHNWQELCSQALDRALSEIEAEEDIGGWQRFVNFTTISPSNPCSKRIIRL